MAELHGAVGSQGVETGDRFGDKPSGRCPLRGIRGSKTSLCMGFGQGLGDGEAFVQDGAIRQPQGGDQPG